MLQTRVPRRCRCSELPSCPNMATGPISRVPLRVRLNISGHRHFLRFFSFVFFSSAGEPSTSREPVLLTLPISILPVNDAPELSLPSGALQLAESSKLLLSATDIAVSDPDNDPPDLTVRVLAAAAVQLESRERPGHPLTSFTYKELLDNQLRLAHLGSQADGHLVLQASDGLAASQVGPGTNWMQLMVCFARGSQRAR